MKILTEIKTSIQKSRYVGKIFRDANKKLWVFINA